MKKSEKPKKKLSLWLIMIICLLIIGIILLSIVLFNIINSPRLSNYNLGGISCNVNNNWKYLSGDNFDYFYPEKDNKEIFMMVGMINVEDTDISQEDFESATDSLLEGIIGDSNSVSRINNKEIKKSEDFYIANIDIKKDMANKYRHILVSGVFDNKSGIYYLFCFIFSDENSNKHKTDFGNIIDSIKIR